MILPIKGRPKPNLQNSGPKVCREKNNYQNNSGHTIVRTMRAVTRRAYPGTWQQIYPWHLSINTGSSFKRGSHDSALDKLLSLATTHPSFRSRSSL